MILHSTKDLAAMSINQRKKLGLTQIEVADRVGLTQKTISAFENRPESVMLATALLILSSLELELELIPKNNGPSKISKWNQEW